MQASQRRASRMQASQCKRLGCRHHNASISDAGIAMQASQRKHRLRFKFLPEKFLRIDALRSRLVVVDNELLWSREKPAEEEGFEPPIRVNGRRFSRPLQSTALPLLFG